MNRVRDYDGETAAERVSKRRSRLIDAGRLLFGEYGYAGTSRRAVLRQAGMGDPYFTESFPDLDSLLAAVYDQILDEELVLGRAAILAASGPSEAARAMMESISRALKADPGRARIKLRESLSAGPVTAHHRRAGYRRLAQLLADLMPATPQSTQRDRLFLSTGLIASGDAYLLAWLSGEPGMSRRRVVDLVTTLFDAVVAQNARLESGR